MSHTSLFTSHLFHKFKSKVSFTLNQHNKHLFFLAKIHFRRACKHAHVELFRNSAQCMVSIVGELPCMLQHQMTMFDFSNNQHCIFISSKVVTQVKGLIKANCSFVKQPNHVI